MLAKKLHNGVEYLGSVQNPYLIAMNLADTSATEVALHPNCKFIYDAAFQNCSSLRQIYIPVGMEYIFEDAFAGCENLTSIEYGGTMAQWNAMPKGNGWNSDLSCTVVCRDGSIDPT